MAELDFSHNVSEIPAGQPLPSPVPRKEHQEISGIPNIQGAVTNYAENTNWMSSIGSEVASKASNALAQKIGSELGKNPKGDLGIPLTDFDKTMQESYRTQAQATLGLQADKLITDSNIAAASADRVTPDLISKSQSSISSGLQKIISQAPSEIQPNLQKIYGDHQLTQFEHLTNRMLSEQHEDLRNNTILSNNKYAETAHALAAAGKFDAAERVVKTTEAMNKSAVSRNVGFSPQQGKVGTDTVRQSAINGKLQYEYEHAPNKEKYLKDLAKKPDWISDADYPSAVESIKSYVGNQKALTANYEQVTMTDFRTKMLTDMGSITGTELQSVLDKLSPTNAATLNYQYTKAHEQYNKDSLDQNLVEQNWDNAEVLGRTSPKVMTNAFNNLVDKLTQYHGPFPAVTRAEAEMQVASRAGASIPEYVKILNLKGASSNPQQLEEFGESVNKIYDAGKGQNISKVDPQAIANFEKYNVLKNNGMLPVEAAQQAHEIVYGKSRQQKEANDENYIQYIKNKKATGETDQQFFMELAGLDKDAIVRNGQAYANQMRTTFESYFKMLNGDATTATKMLKRSVDHNYGNTSINGIKEYTYAPIDKLLNLPPDSEGVIHSDIAEQLGNQLASTNQAYKDGRSDWHWEVKPQMSVEQALSHESVPDEFKNSRVRTQGVIQRNIDKFNKQNKVEVHKIYRDGRIEKYNVVIQANPYASRTVDPNVPLLGGWNVMLSSDKGMSTIPSLDPSVGSISYRPNVAKINETIKKLHSVRYGVK